MPVDNFRSSAISDNLDIRASISDLVSVDAGNRTIQGRISSKTLQLAYFTNNRNAVWAARRNLQLASYPFAEINVPVNRALFRLEVGDCFKFSNTRYGITDMICRVQTIQEEGPESEKIIIGALEDIYAVSSAVTKYTGPPVRHAGIKTDYAVVAFDYERVMESPYVLAGEDMKIMAIAARKSPRDIGFDLHLSIDGGSSYFLLQSLSNIVPFGTLVNDYSASTYTIDDNGFIVEFNSDVAQVETRTFADILAGIANTAILGDEIISFQEITPVAGSQYLLSTVIRGRFGTQRQAHAAGEQLYLIPNNLSLIEHAEIEYGAQRYFKLVPYNSKRTGDISDSDAVVLTVAGLSRTPYVPVNLLANGGGRISRYVDDIVLTWSPRKRGEGAGIGMPGVVLPTTDREGLFRVEVAVGAVIVRTVEAIDAATWTYTEAMNVADNGTPADYVTFNLTNYIGNYESPAATVTSRRRGTRADALAYLTRVLADGGVVIDMDYVNDIFQMLANESLSPEVWLSPIAGVKKDGSNKVSKLYDLTSHNRDVSQVTSSKQPIWTVAQQNGLPGIVFDAVDDVLLGTTFSAPTNYTLLNICKIPDMGYYSVSLKDGLCSSTGMALGKTDNGDGHRRAITRAEVSWYKADAQSQNTEIIIGGFSTACWMRVNGVAKTIDAGAHTAPSGGNFSYGGIDVSGGQRGKTMFDAAGFSVSISTAQSQAIEALLNAKWAVY